MDQCKRICLRQFALQISNKCCPHGSWVSHAESRSAADLEVGIHGVLHSGVKYQLQLEQVPSGYTYMCINDYKCV